MSRTYHKERPVFAQRVYKRRVEKGLRQDEIAEYCGVSVTSYGRYERGATDPPLTIAIRIAERLDVSLDYLTGLADEKGLEHSAIRQIQRILDEMGSAPDDVATMLEKKGVRHGQ